jgi:predicted lipoprotein with Yx(FWY)xxD motif
MRLPLIPTAGEPLQNGDDVMRRDVKRASLLAVGMLASLVTLAACGSSSSPGSGSATTPATRTPAATSGSGIKTASTKIGTVLTTSKGLTIYWFAKDTPTKSNCNGSCASYWPPVKGPVKAASGVSLPGKFGTITRSDGSIQATYDGHPLYTYTGDSAAGQTNGNGLNLSGGLWYAMTPSGSKPAAAPKPSSSSSSSGYYG